MLIKKPCLSEPAWTEGPPGSEMASIAKYWAEKYNWTDIQQQLNTNFSHYMATDLSTEGNYKGTLDVHFIHERSNRSDATPLLMLHGWPSTSQEWKDVIPSLVHPEKATDPAFHIIAPDLPGYGFSSTPTAPGMCCSEHATLFANLMVALNYSSYAVYNTDLGFYMAQQLVRKYEDRMINHITDFYLVPPNSTDIA